MEYDDSFMDAAILEDADVAEIKQAIADLTTQTALLIDLLEAMADKIARAK
jgi:hypothetical protein